MVRIKEQNYSAKDIFQNLKELRTSKIDEKLFWENYLLNISSFCESSYTVIVKKDSSFEAVSSLQDKNTEINETELLKILSNCTPKLSINNFAYEPLEMKIKSCSKPFLVYFKLDNSQWSLNDYYLGIILDRNNPNLFNEHLIRVSLTTDIFANYLNNKYSSQDQNTNITISDSKSFELLEFFNLIRKEKKFLKASMSFVNEVSLKFKTTRVSLGWKNGEYIKTVALSNLDTFDEKSQIITLLETVFEECADQETIISINENKDDKNITRCHEKYIQSNNLKSLVSFPFIIEDEVVGVLTLEHNEDFIPEQDLTLIQICVQQMAYWMNELNKQDKWIGKRLYHEFLEYISWYLGANNSLLKFIGTTLAIVLFICFVFEIDYKIEAKATLETDNVAFLSAPYDGFVKDVKYYSGEEVKKDEVLITLDSQELFLKKVEAQADVTRFLAEAEKARASKELANMNISIARMEQAQSILERTKYYLEQSQIKSPFDGIIVDGDKKQLTGTPVSKGDLLIKVANPSNIYIKFKVSETDIDELELNQNGELKLLSEPGVYYPIKVENIIPLAQADSENGNIFVLKASFVDEPKTWWRPGMSGVTKINVGKRKIYWVITHKTIDFLKMYFWI